MLYAAYGSNLHPDRLNERVPSARLCGSSVLDGWGLRFHKRGQDGSSKCDIVPCLETLFVAVYEINLADKPHLDKAESLGHGYLEKEIDIPDFGTCFLYVAQDSHIDASLKPYGWYKELVLIGCSHHGFPAEYVDMIQRVPHVDDHDTQRHERWMSLVNKNQRFVNP
jgi:gamma-glutamylcyclotransferase